MAETATGKATPESEHVQGRRKEVVGEVVANRMQKTIVVKVTRKKAHPFTDGWWRATRILCA